MGRVIDSTVLVAAECRQLDFRRLQRELAGEPLVLAAITASELLEGVPRIPDLRVDVA